MVFIYNMCLCVCERENVLLFFFARRRRFSYFKALDFEVIAHFSDLYTIMLVI